VRVKPKTTGIASIMHNPWDAVRSTLFEWQTDPFIWVASGQTYL